MSSPPAAEASGSAGASSAVGKTAYRPCEGGECRPLGPAPSPEPTFHSHWWNPLTGHVSERIWGPPGGTATANTAETIAAPRTAAGGRRRGNNSGERSDERGERRKAGGEAAAAATAASVEQMEAVEVWMLLFDRQPVQLALPAQPAQGVDLPAPMVPVWKVLDAADVSQKLGRDDALHRLDDCVHYLSTSSPIRKGASSQGGVGVFTTQPFEEQEVVMAFRRHRSPVSKQLAARRTLSMNGYVVHNGGDPIYLEVSTFGFPARVMNNSDKPNVFVCTVTAGFSQEKYVFVFSLRSISVGEELFHDPVDGMISL